MARGREKRVKDAEIEAKFREATMPFLSTQEAADLIGLQEDTARDRLRKLEDENILASRVAPGNNLIWWLESRVLDDEEDISKELDPTIEVPIVDAIDIPGSAATEFDRRHIVATVFRYLIIHESASPNQIASIGWAAGKGGYNDADGLYRSTLHKALDQSILFKKSINVNLWRLTSIGREFREEFLSPTLANLEETPPMVEWNHPILFWQEQVVGKYRDILSVEVESRSDEFPELPNDSRLNLPIRGEQPYSVFMPRMNERICFSFEFPGEFWTSRKIIVGIHHQFREDRESMEPLREQMKSQELLSNAEHEIMSYRDFTVLYSKKLWYYTHDPDDKGTRTIHDYHNLFRDFAEMLVTYAAKFNQQVKDFD